MFLSSVAITPAPERRPSSEGWASTLTYAVAAVIGVALGLSQTIGGAYDESRWTWFALGALVAALALAIARPRRPPVAGLLLIGLGVWSLISTGWAESVDQAWIAGNRWIFYGIALIVLVWVLDGRRGHAEVLLGAAAAAVVAVALWMLFRMLSNDGVSLFLGARLNDPLGYFNGQAAYLLAALWPCCALAERGRPPALAGLGAAAMVVLIALGTFPRSRSWELALAVSALVVVAALPGRRRRIAVFVLVAAAVFAIHGSLTSFAANPTPTDGALHHGAIQILVAAVGAGAVWALACWLLDRLAPHGSRQRTVAARTVGIAIVAAVALGAVAVAVNGSRVAHRVSSEYHDFTHLSSASTSDRFLSGGGNRYDYWRVAWKEFTAEPLRGVGAGSYPVDYYRDRRTTEAIEQPHSLELQTLAELGIVGAALLAGFLVVAGLGIFRAARAAVRDPGDRALAVAATGVFVAWLAQTSVDWEHLIPGLSGMALAALAAIGVVGGKRSEHLGRNAGGLVIAGCVVLVGFGALVMVPRLETVNAQAAAQSDLDRGDPAGAITEATRALKYDSNNVNALVLRSAGFARFDAFDQARADLRRALRIEPENWSTWGLLGDLLTRRGQRGAARAAYRRALALDPREPGLIQALAQLRSPASASG